jgi:signal transduction histidine kinase
MSVRARLLLLFSLVVGGGVVGFLALWLLGVPALGIEGMFTQEIRRAVSSTEVLADKERDTYERWFAEHRRALWSWSQSPELSRMVIGVTRAPQANGGALRAALARRLLVLKEISPGSFRTLYIVGPDGQRILASDAAGQVRMDPDHADAIAETLQPGMTESVRLLSSTTHAAGVGVLNVQQIPQLDADDQPTGTIAGVLVAELAPDALLAAEDQSILQSLGSAGAVLLADSSGEVMLDSSAIASNTRNRFVARQLQAGSESSKVLRTPEGLELIATFRHLHMGGADTLSLIAIRTTDDALQAIRTSFVRMSVLGLFVSLFALVLFISTTNRVARGQAEILALNAGLEDRIRDRTRELARSNDDLTHAMATLARTQTELVRSEKLAALGSLVAGVSHELNTPLGNSLMAASTMEDQTMEIGKRMEQGIKRSELELYKANMQEGIAILMSSLRRAADLVSSFKQVAADQTSAQRRLFALGQTLDEILLTLGPSIRKSGHQVVAQVNGDIRLDSYPGPLGQVLTNLINNALVHAFPSRSSGAVSISATVLAGGVVEMQVRDNGCGIPPENLGRVFDPFFTTRLGQGGSGLGLNIAYNIVTEVLGGSVTVQSVVGEGTCFVLQLPLSAPKDKTPADLNA